MYSFIHKSLVETQDKIIDLYELVMLLAKKMELTVSNGEFQKIL
jgi:hypothetical protein